jgi:DNA polymerase (family 10)
VSTTDRREVAGRLRELGGFLRLRGDNPFKARAYETAASAIEALGQQFEQLAAEDRLAEVPGIGERLAATIKTLRESGSTSTLERLRAEMPPGVLELTERSGLSLAKVRALHEALGIADVADLEQAAREGRVRQVRGFGPKTEAKVLAALARGPVEPTQMLLVHAREKAEGLRGQLLDLSGVQRVEVAGSIRRWCELVETIRLVVAAEDPPAAAAAYRRVAAFGESLGHEERAGAGLLLRHRLLPTGKVEIEFVSPERFGGALVRQTGTPAHLAALQEGLRERGLALNDVLAREEGEVYEALGLPEIPPELREDPADIARAAAGEFSELVTVADIKGLVHCHTTASDGRHDLREMAEAAAARGMQYLTVTDHSPTASYAGGLSAERLAEQGAEISRLAGEGTLGIELLRGTESDIRADGSLDFSAEVLGTLDVVIASIHNRFGMDEAAMTERLVAAMGQPLFKIWGHALGRILLHRPPIACDVPRVLDAARAGRAAVEINGDPRRLDLAPEWLRQARARGLRFVISVDAHSTRDYDNLTFGVHLARRAGIPRREVLNTLPAAAFRAAVHPRTAG